MSRIATTRDETIWSCDNCENVARSVNAFALPSGWWQAHVERRTSIDEDGRGGKLKRGSIDACSKECLVDAITYLNQYLIEYASKESKR